MANGLFNLKQVVQAVQQGGWPAQKTPAVEYLVVAGGGGAGCGTGSVSNGGGGGGAGGLLQGIDPVPNGQTLLVTVGGGGAGGGSNSNGVNGSNSVFGAITSLGGGFGTASRGGSAGSGGSGGGSGELNVTSGGFAGQGTKGQGNAGGAGLSYPCGGGGGAGTVGSASATGSTTAPGGRGGSGATSVISGTATAYAGGGGGCAYNGSGSTAGTGGVGGGGNANVTGSGTSGTANTGGGGGGSGNTGSSGGSGGSGIVIVSYPDVYAAATTVNATASTSGSGSLFFDGTGDYLTVPDNSAWAFGSGNFTLEAWVYRTVSGATQMIVIQSDNATAAGSAWSFYILSSNKLIANVYYGSSFITLTSSADVPANAWVHVALVRTSGTLSQYINGSRDGTSASLSTNSLNDVAQTVGIGATNAGNDRLTGYLSNIRIIKGSGPYDATASTLTVPTAPLTAITNTQLMLNTVSGALFADASTNSFTVTRNGDVAWNQLSPFATGSGYKNRVYTWTTSGTITF